MEVRIDVDRLVKDELEYELRIRGLYHSGTVGKLRKSLKGALSFEKSGHVFSNPGEIDLSVELEERLVVLIINSPLKLIQFCKKLEETKIKISKYTPPKTGQLSLEPNLDYRGNKSQRLRSLPLVTETQVVNDTNTAKLWEEPELDEEDLERIDDIEEDGSSEEESDEFSPPKQVVGEFVAFLYEGNVISEQITIITEEGPTIKAMKRVGKLWKWPDRPDVLDYPWDNVLGRVTKKCLQK
ncbi:hypothetical protein FQA39_LY05093 [Lamprigera yunnana]|nr:hypothetical protein FQA39_LY05093 [Lamprigera yunnana]